MANFYISDIHINHFNVLNCDGSSNFDGRPFKTFDEMNETILNNINRVCSEDDDLYILGDLLWKVNDKPINWVKQIKPRLHLIKGNHDKINLEYKKLFVEICDYKEVKDVTNGKQYHVVLFHYPIMFWNGMHRNWIHLYGHVHNSFEEDIYQNIIKQLNDKHNFNCQAYNVGCMHWNYTPVTLEQILVTNKNVDTLDK